MAGTNKEQRMARQCFFSQEAMQIVRLLPETKRRWRVHMMLAQGGDSIVASSATQPTSGEGVRILDAPQCDQLASEFEREWTAENQRGHRRAINLGEWKSCRHMIELIDLNCSVQTVIARNKGWPTRIWVLLLR